MVFETSVFKKLNHLTRLIARENFIILTRQERIKSSIHNEDVHNLYVPPNIIRALTSKRVRLAGHVACIGGMRTVYKFLSENLKERDHLEHLSVDRNIILKWISGE
jgi:dihydrofolate reductase